MLRRPTRIPAVGGRLVVGGTVAASLNVYLLAWRLRSNCQGSACFGSFVLGAPCMRTGRLNSFDVSPNLELPTCTVGVTGLVAVEVGSGIELAIIRGGARLATDMLSAAGAETGDHDPVDYVHELYACDGEARLRPIVAHPRDDVRALHAAMTVPGPWTRS